MMALRNYTYLSTQIVNKINNRSLHTIYKTNLLTKNISNFQKNLYRSFSINNEYVNDDSTMDESMISNEFNKKKIKEISQILDNNTPSTSPNGGFADQQDISKYNVSNETKTNLLNAGITSLFPVQALSYDIMMSGKDIMGRSKTGSGKTLAFALPIVEKIIQSKKENKLNNDHTNKYNKSKSNPLAIVLLPTRELATQVAKEFYRIAPQLKCATLVGGVSYDIQERMLYRGTDIIVCTPGRLMDLMEKKNYISLDNIQVAVLDEADMMLKFGFQEAVEMILGKIPNSNKQCVFWSATVPKWVNSMAKKFLNNPEMIDLVGENDTHIPSTVGHKAILAGNRNRPQILATIIETYNKNGQSLIFTDTKKETDELFRVLGPSTCRALHGDLSQGTRTSTLNAFRDGSVKTLVCTDIAARGLDIANVELIVQYRLPRDRESFVHRAGRTGRAGRSGVNIVLFDHNDLNELKFIEKSYQINFGHISIPHAEKVIELSMDSICERINYIEKKNNIHSHLIKKAQELIDTKGIQSFAAALAMIGGFEKNIPTCYSMMTGAPGMQTMKISCNNINNLTNKKCSELINNISGTYQIYDSKIYRFNQQNLLLFDVPKDVADKLLNGRTSSILNINENINENEHIILEIVEELPEVFIPNQSSRRSFEGNKFGRNNYDSNRRSNYKSGYNSGYDTNYNKSNTNWNRKDRKPNSTRNRRNSYDY